MQQIAKNVFSGGLNQDIDPAAVPNNTYIDAHNVTLTGEGTYMGLSNFRGTSEVGSMTTGITTIQDCNVKLVPAKFKIGDTEDVNCMVAFIAATEAGGQGAIYITVRDLDNDDLYLVYRERSIGTDYFTSERIFDTRVYPENGIDYIYFSDDYSEDRRLRCEIPTGSPSFFLTEFDLSLSRWGAGGNITFSSLVAGTLLSGSYQFAYRMVDPDNKRFTKWSSPTNPFFVYSRANDNGPVFSGVGQPSPFGIAGQIIPSTPEANNFEYYQLAVIENIYDISSPAIAASLLPVTAFTGSPQAFTYKSNESIGKIPIQDIVIDLAAIKSSKTLSIKQNTMFKGGLKYYDLSFDNGEPAVTSGSIDVAYSSDSQKDMFSDAYLSSVSKGYFRDEVYRFGIVYFDKYGNKSPVKVLDLNGITDNQISGVLPDVRFPSRATSNSYTLFNNIGSISSLGLLLQGLTNTPSWAVGFEIVRAKRIKKILFQTPVIPMTTIESVGALDDFPSQAVTVDGGGADTEYPDAVPPSTLATYTTKNLFWPELRAIQRRASNGSGIGAATAKKGEAILTAKDQITGQLLPASNFAMIFPQSSMYGDVPFTPNGAEKFQTIDYCLAKSWISDFETGSHPLGGEHITTKLSGVWYSLLDGDYYFDSTWSAKSIPSTKSAIKSYRMVESLNEPVVFSGNSFFDYQSIAGTGINWGKPQQVQKAAIIEASSTFDELNATAKVFANGTLNAYTAGPSPRIVGASGPFIESALLINNKYINEYSGYVNGSSYNQAFRIINVINDYGDDRYGNIDTQHEFISTGARYTFSASQLADLAAGNPLEDVDITVYGGDCFVAPHTFKVADTWYSVINQAKNQVPATAESSANLLTRWDGRYYLNSAGAALSVPVPVEGAAQFIQVLLESEYNGGVMTEDVLGAVTTATGGFPVMNLNPDQVKKGAIRSPLTYRYNLNISKQNDQKIYFPKPAINFDQLNYKSRIAYTDTKIYGSDIQGFDVTRVGNVYDLEESRGGLTKLAIEGDRMYGIQERGIVYLPTGQTQAELTDANLLAIGTGQVIGRHIVIDQSRGGQNLAAIVEAGNAIYIPDSFNNAIYTLSNNQIVAVNEIGLSSTFRDLPEANLFTIYDITRGEFWLVNNEDENCYVFSQPLGLWLANFEMADCKAGVHNKDLYLANWTGTEVNLQKMYVGDYNQFFGTTVTPRVTVVVNPETDLSKTFDNLALVATQRLATASFLVPRESGLGNQTATRSIDNEQVQGANYRIKNPRAADGSRLRGTRCNITINWKTGANDQATLSSILTKYRLSSRVPF